MKTKALALFSGGLDSLLAVQLVRQQAIDVLGITFETPFFSARRARLSAERIDLPLLVADITADHLRMLRAPRYGFGKNMNPCIDCHALMIRLAARKLPDLDARFLITGEVLGQRPLSQTRQALHVVAKHSGCPDAVVRPLSAKLLPETPAEREGWIDRNGLLDLQGRGRKRQMALARDFGITDYPAPAGGCLLTDPEFSRRLRDLFAGAEPWQVRDIELLKYGRQFRLGNRGKIIVGRNHGDNAALESLALPTDAILKVEGHPGPLVLTPYGGDADVIALAAALCVRYSDAPKTETVTVTCDREGKRRTLPACADAATHRDLRKL